MMCEQSEVVLKAWRKRGRNFVNPSKKIDETIAAIELREERRRARRESGCLLEKSIEALMILCSWLSRWEKRPSELVTRRTDWLAKLRRLTLGLEQRRFTLVFTGQDVRKESLILARIWWRCRIRPNLADVSSIFSGLGRFLRLITWWQNTATIQLNWNLFETSTNTM